MAALNSQRRRILRVACHPWVLFVLVMTLAYFLTADYRDRNPPKHRKMRVEKPPGITHDPATEAHWTEWHSQAERTGRSD